MACWRLPLLLFCSLLAAAAPAQDAAPRPNIVLILSDDQGTVDLGVCGTEDAITPHLDALASRGLRFTQFYAASPICSPSRAGLLTGRYPHRVGVPGNVWPGGPGLRGDETTLAEVFRDAGYATALFGKWHLGSRPGERPNDQGFERFFGHHKGCIDNWSHFFYWSGPNRHDLWRDEVEVWEEGAHFGDLIVREARAFLRERAAADDGRPFLLYLPFNSPHYPLQGKAEHRALFAGTEGPRADYLALLATMDAQIGAVLGELDALGMREDTIVVFQSDHGHSTEERSFGGGGSAGPYRGAKFSLFEGGIRVPAILSWPGRLAEGAVTEELGHAMDWLPTLCELAGVAPPPELDGRSLVPVIHGRGVPPTPRLLHWQVGDQWAVRIGAEKLIRNPRDTDRSKLKGADARFFVDLGADPGERRNLAADQEDLVEAFTALHRTWREDVDGLEQKVLFLGLDGVRADALRAADTPHLDSLIAAGGFTDRARGVGMSGHSGPNWASLLTGLEPSRHGVSANGDDPEDLGVFPHLFRLVKQARPELHTASFAKWTPINAALTPDDVAELEFSAADGFEVPQEAVDGDPVIAAEVARFLRGEGKLPPAEPDVVVVHLDQVDGAGHAHGYHPEQPEYLAAIERVDALVGEILAALRSREDVERGREQWLVLVTTDHGGYGRGGQNTGHSITGEEEQDEAVRSTWWILSGPTVPAGAELGAPRAVDAVPTMLHHLRVDPGRFSLDGRVVIPAAPTPTAAPASTGAAPPGGPEAPAGPPPLRFTFTPVAGIGPEAGLIRRDPSDVVAVGDRHLVWYTKLRRGMPTYPEGYGGEIWYAESRDEGRSWTERGRALGHGPAGGFDAHGVFTPNVLQHEGSWFLYYTAVAEGFTNAEVAASGRTVIAVARADSPDGPWVRPRRPILASRWEQPGAFDSYRVDDACLAVGDEGELRLYYKGRSVADGRSGPRHTRMGLATAASPEGPFRRVGPGPIQDSGHEVLVFPQGGAWWSLVSPHGPRGRSLRFSFDGMDFDQHLYRAIEGPALRAPGLFRPELSGGQAPLPGAPRWGLHMSGYGGEPGLERFELQVAG